MQELLKVDISVKLRYSDSAQCRLTRKSCLQLQKCLVEAALLMLLVRLSHVQHWLLHRSSWVYDFAALAPFGRLPLLGMPHNYLREPSAYPSRK